MDQKLGKRIIDLTAEIVANFTHENRREVGLLTGYSEAIDNYPRLLRSLSWSDDDYSGNVLGILQQIAQRDLKAFSEIERYVYSRFGNQDVEYISSKPSRTTHHLRSQRI
jgi:AbiJ N-terminal domain 5